MNQKEVVHEYLSCAYAGAKAMDDVEMMIRLTRAMIAFDYDSFEEEEISWNKMLNAYINRR